MTIDQACLQLTSQFFFFIIFFKFNQNKDILSVETRNIDVGIFFSSLDTSPCPHRITAYLELPLSQLSAFHIHKVLYHFPYRISAFHLNTLFYYFPGQYDYTWAYHGKVGVLRSFLLWANCRNTNQFFADSRRASGRWRIGDAFSRVIDVVADVDDDVDVEENVDDGWQLGHNLETA